MVLRVERELQEDVREPLNEIWGQRRTYLLFLKLGYSSRGTVENGGERT